MMRLFRRNRKGFTLVELVVVIAILGILAAIAVPRFMNAIGQANQATDAANQKVIQAAVNMYFMENNHYPGQAADGTGTWTDPYVWADLQGDLESDYIDSLPSDTGKAGSFTYSEGFVAYAPN